MHDHPILANVISGVWLLTAIGGLINLLPAISTAIGIIWFALMIYESQLVTNWLKRRRRHKIIKLKAHLAKLQMIETDDAILVAQELAALNVAAKEVEDTAHDEANKH